MASPEGAVTHSSVVDWTDCSMKCSASLTCTFWQWEVSSGTCTTVTGTGDGSLTVDDGFVVGKRGCYSYLESSGWKTCTDNQLNDTMDVGQQMLFFFSIFVFFRFLTHLIMFQEEHSALNLADINQKIIMYSMLQTSHVPVFKIFQLI